MSIETEMSSYPRQLGANNRVTFWQLYERAAKAQFGNVSIIKTPDIEKEVNKIIDKFHPSILKFNDSQPREESRIIVDVNMKEYTNRGTEAQDETIVKASKTTSKTEGSRYNFSSTTGVEFGGSANIGLQLVGMGGAGIGAGVGGHYNKAKSTTAEAEHSKQEEFSFSYDQEEKITVPPGKCVKARITTFRMKYKMSYTVKFSISKIASVPVSYWTNCCCFGSWLGRSFGCCFGGCFGLCKRTGVLPISSMISTLCDYNGDEEGYMASFTQDLTMTWIGEGCTVDKEEEQIY